MHQDTREAMVEQAAQVVINDADNNDGAQPKDMEPPPHAYDVNTTDNPTTASQQINGFHDNPEHQAMDTNDNESSGVPPQDAQEQEEDYLQEIDEQATSQTEEEDYLQEIDEQATSQTEACRLHLHRNKRRVRGLIWPNLKRKRHRLLSDVHLALCIKEAEDMRRLSRWMEYGIAWTVRSKRKILFG
eukprot:225419_1